MNDEVVADDAIESSEDPLDPSRLIADSSHNVMNESNESEDSGAQLPNNDFCYTEEDFMESRQMMNDATRHHGTYLHSWNTIKSLVGQTVVTNSSTHGSLTWTVVGSVVDDDFKDIRQQEVEYSQTSKRPHTVSDEASQCFDKDDSYADAFWKLWPCDIESEIAKLNNIIERDNIKRKENYQRPIKKVEKSEYLMFHALMIASSAYSGQGETLWLREYYKNKTKKRRIGLLQAVDFGEYLKLWRFDQIKMYIAEVMEDPNLKDSDDWWRFKSRVDLFNRKRILGLMMSHILVFDESMSAFVPR